MKRELLEKYLGKKIEITISDKTKFIGTLEKGNGFFYTDKDYFLPEAHFCFKCSHVIKVVEQ